MPYTLRTVLASLVLLFSAAAAARAQRVEIIREDGAHKLIRNGEPYFIKGAGGQSNLDLLVENGGNSIRTWHIENAQSVLDAAHDRGLTVCMGIWLQHPRHGFDYGDTEAVEAQQRMVREAVLRFKDHPALLMWGLGNEVELESDHLLVFPEIEKIAAMVKELDPVHPRMTVIAGPDREKIEALAGLCPSIDVIGVNAYGNAHLIPDQLSRAQYDGPYIVTEFGPRGWWESRKTDWGVPIEPTSAEKAAQYRRGYTEAVLGDNARCLGSYVFLWGQKQEATETWFGMFLKDGGRTPTVDVMREMWTGSPPPNRAPLVSGIRGEVAEGRIEPGQEFTLRAVASDPDGDDIEYEWVIIAESTDRRSGGDPEAAPPRLPELTLADGRIRARLRAPSEPGPYRVFVFARDGHGGVGTANVPFLVD